MRKYVILIVMLFLSYVSQAQYRTNYYDNIQVSLYSSYDFSKGVEIRGTWQDWYIAFQGENFISKSEKYFNWGFSIGKFDHYGEKFTFFYGGRAGFLKVLESQESKPLFGTEFEIAYDLSDVAYIGIRGTVDVYFDSPSYDEPKAYSMVRPFIKLGFIF